MPRARTEMALPGILGRQQQRDPGVLTVAGPEEREAVHVIPVQVYAHVSPAGVFAPVPPGQLHQSIMLELVGLHRRTRQPVTATSVDVERDLHDGAQQHLVALAVNLRLARDIIAEDPDAGTEMLAQMAEDVQATIRELRELAHGICPPLLADNGLGDALRAAASRSALPVTVSTDGIGHYSQGVETAIYFCCLEALQNAGMHAAGATVDVRLWEESGGLLFSVSDNGPGFEAARVRGGHGFVNMSDRLGAIGGTVRWEAQPGQGSTISGSVPII